MPAIGLHDLPAYVHTGMHINEYETFSFQGFPMGGIKYFLKQVTYHLTGSYECAFFMDSASDRKSLIPSYKAGRVNRNDINSQIELLEGILLKCKISVYKEDGFEADDLIFSAVQDLKPTYDRIQVYSGDIDLTHNVDQKVDFEAVNSNVSSIDRYSFSHGVEKGKNIMFNTISAYKVFSGCNSDKIPVFKSENREVKWEFLYTEFCNFLTANVQGTPGYALTSDPRALRIFLRDRDKSLPQLTENDMVELDKRIKVIYPRKCDGLNVRGCDPTTIDVDELVKILTICRDLPSIGLLGKKPIAPTQQDIDFFRQRARDLQTGAFAATNRFSIAEPVKQGYLEPSREFY